MPHLLCDNELRRVWRRMAVLFLSSSDNRYVRISAVVIHCRFVLYSHDKANKMYPWLFTKFGGFWDKLEPTSYPTLMSEIL